MRTLLESIHRIYVDFGIDISAPYLDNGYYSEGRMAGLVFVRAEGKNWLDDCSTIAESCPERSQSE